VNTKGIQVTFWLMAALAQAVIPAMAQETNRVDPKSFDAFKIITDRNIFDASRRVYVPGAASKPRPVVDTFALTGTMSYENGSFAVFDGNNADYHRVIGAGGKIAGYSVAEITHDSVKLLSDTNVVELKVGMQMRRTEDGKWSATVLSGPISFASTSRNGNSEQTGRRLNQDRTSSRTGSNVTGPAAPGSGRETSVDAGNLDPNDILARLMANRNRETGVNVDQREEGSAVENQNGSDENPNRPDQLPNPTLDTTNSPPANSTGNPRDVRRNAN
jgi:hypothetical protein